MGITNTCAEIANFCAGIAGFYTGIRNFYGEIDSFCAGIAGFCTGIADFCAGIIDFYTVFQGGVIQVVAKWRSCVVNGENTLHFSRAGKGTGGLCGLPAAPSLQTQ
jgi:hypothetical protein